MVEKGVPDEVVLDELDGLFALLAAQRRRDALRGGDGETGR